MSKLTLVRVSKGFVWAPGAQLSWGGGMQRLFFMFPSGAPGVGLILLRIAVSVQLLEIGWFDSGRLPQWIGFLCVLFATLLFLGVLTPAVAVLAALTTGFDLLGCSVALLVPLATIICSTLALALLGPGAYSLDAKLFGRRLVEFPALPDA